MPVSPKDAIISVRNQRRWGLPGVILRACLVLPVSGAIAASLAGFLLYAHFAKDLPSVEELRSVGSPSVTRFYAADGQLAGEWYRERRIHLTWEEMPKELILAFLAAEDARFFNHEGVDLRSIARATLQNLKAGAITSGASTITQQLAKTIVGADKNLERKAREGIMARRIEDIFGKKEILTRYLNSIYLGYHSYGVQAAAQNYFRKDVSGLSLSEMAMLAGLPVAPSAKNPVVNMDGARERMTYVLGQMERWGWITSNEAEQARRADVDVKPRPNPLQDLAPYYTELVRSEVRKKYASPDHPDSWLDRGLTVYMHVEPSMQHVARRALRSSLEDLARIQGYAGPLGQMAKEDFLQANERWLGNTPPEPGDRHLARLSSVTKTGATAQIGAGLHGSFDLKRTRWAGPYRALKGGGKGGRKKKGKVSFKPRLRDLRKAFSEGDVVLVDVIDGPPDALRLSIVPPPLIEGALASATNHGGGPDVAVGGWDFDRSQLNRVKSVRKTGSIIKPIIYSKAYDLNIAPSTMLSGAPFREGKYNPTGTKSKDDMTLWEALTHSKNNVSLRVLQSVLHRTSLADYKAWGRRLGLSRPLKGNPAEALGGDHSVLDITQAFGTFARHGHTPSNHLIRKVVEDSGRVLERHISPIDPNTSATDSLVSLWDQILTSRPQPIRDTTAYLTTANMLEVVSRGTGKRAQKLGRITAGKTGTLDYDVWFAGFTWSRTAVVWLGADRYERPLGKFGKSGILGGNTALPAWVEFMKRIDQARPSRKLPSGPKPKDIDLVYIDPSNGLLLDKGGVLMPHIMGTEPEDKSFDEISPENIEDLEGEF
jgi:penicillin-binding protein 1A